MARPFNRVRTINWKIPIPIDVAAAVEELHWNSYTQKPRYGAKSDLVVTLLRKWLETQESATEQLGGVSASTAIPSSEERK